MTSTSFEDYNRMKELMALYKVIFGGEPANDCADWRVFEKHALEFLTTAELEKIREVTEGEDSAMPDELSEKINQFARAFGPSTMLMFELSRAQAKRAIAAFKRISDGYETLAANTYGKSEENLSQSAKAVEGAKKTLEYYLEVIGEE